MPQKPPFAVAAPTGPDPDDAMLVNNVDLTIEFLETGAEFLPWLLDPDLANETAAARSAAATRGTDDRNNVERVTIAAPAAGRLTSLWNTIIGNGITKDWRITSLSPSSDRRKKGG